MTAAVRLSGRASKLARKGHPWFFRDDLDPDRGGDLEDGDLVRVETDRGQPLGAGFYSSHSRLALRLCGSWPADRPLEPEPFFRRRLLASIARRDDLRGPGKGARLVHGEADGLPGLVADQYDRCVVVQVTAAAVERHLDCVVPVLVEATGATSVLARNDVATRRFEDLPREIRLLHGRRPGDQRIVEHGVTHVVRPFEGHKTGFYLDQRPARGRVLQLAAGRRVLDLFCYQGAFALAALAGGAGSVLAVDQSEPALARARAGAGENGLAGLETRAASAFDLLRELRGAGASFDLVIVDPPAFAKRRAERAGALRGYRDLNRGALRVLAPGGLLLTCSCSHHVDRQTLEDVVRQAAAELPFRVVLRERLMAGPDHPVWLGLPESEYLKVCLLQRVDD